MIKQIRITIEYTTDDPEERVGQVIFNQQEHQDASEIIDNLDDWVNEYFEIAEENEDDNILRKKAS